MIAIFDEDGGGDVDFQEFVSGLSAFSSKGNKEQKLKFAFKVYDIDRDGYISNGELFIVLKMMVGSNLKDQQLQQIVDKTIMEADLDKDGKISFEEFAKMVESTDVSNSMTLGPWTLSLSLLVSQKRLGLLIAVGPEQTSFRRTMYRHVASRDRDLDWEEAKAFLIPPRCKHRLDPSAPHPPWAELASLESPSDGLVPEGVRLVETVLCSGNASLVPPSLALASARLRWPARLAARARAPVARTGRS